LPALAQPPTQQLPHEPQFLMSLEKSGGGTLHAPHWQLAVQVCVPLQLQPWLSPGVHALGPQYNVLPQPSGMVPHTLPCAAQLVGVQPQTFGVPLPPQV
jgi:hypothetical protein